MSDNPSGIERHVLKTGETEWTVSVQELADRLKVVIDRSQPGPAMPESLVELWLLPLLEQYQASGKPVMLVSSLGVALLTPDQAHLWTTKPPEDPGAGNAS